MESKILAESKVFGKSFIEVFDGGNRVVWYVDNYSGRRIRTEGTTEEFWAMFDQKAYHPSFIKKV